MAKTYGERFGSANYNWPNAPKNSVQAQAMAWSALAKARQNYLRATVKNFTLENDVLPEVNRIFDGLPRSTDAGLLSNAAGAIQGYSAIFRDGGEVDILRGAEIALRGALAPGYYKDAANPPFFFFVDDKKVIILGSSRGPINQTVNAGTDKYKSIVADLQKNGRAVDAATATASARGAATAQSTELPAAATAGSEQTFLDRLLTDPVGAVKDAFSNPYVLGGTALVGAGLVYWFFIREPAASPARANRRRRRNKREDVEVEVDEDVDEDVDADEDVEVEEEEVEEEEEEAPRPKKYGKRRKNRRGGR